MHKKVLVLALLSCLLVGCLGEKTVYQTIYVCSDGSQVTDPSQCPRESQATTTTKYVPAFKCRVYPADMSCEDETGIYYGLGMCVNDVLKFERYICNRDTDYCELDKMDADFNCTSRGLVCMTANRRELMSSPLNVVMCGKKEDDPTWRPNRYIQINVNKDDIKYKQIQEKD